jgi:hypothetical protein
MTLPRHPASAATVSDCGKIVIVIDHFSEDLAVLKAASLDIEISLGSHRASGGAGGRGSRWSS